MIKGINLNSAICQIVFLCFTLIAVALSRCAWTAFSRLLPSKRKIWWQHGEFNRNNLLYLEIKITSNTKDTIHSPVPFIDLNIFKSMFPSHQPQHHVTTSYHFMPRHIVVTWCHAVSSHVMFFLSPQVISHDVTKMLPHRFVHDVTNVILFLHDVTDTLPHMFVHDVTNILSHPLLCNVTNMSSQLFADDVANMLSHLFFSWHHQYVISSVCS